MWSLGMSEIDIEEVVGVCCKVSSFELTCDCMVRCEERGFAWADEFSISLCSNSMVHWMCTEALIKRSILGLATWSIPCITIVNAAPALTAQV